MTINLKELSKKYMRNAPGYYSYPTIVDFCEFNESIDIQRIICDKNQDDTLSLYVHIPFCQSLCYYCGCHREITKDRNKGKIYISNVKKEMEMYSSYLGEKILTSVHLGGGSPNFLTEEALADLLNAIRLNFNLAEDIQYSIEVDPRTISSEQIIFLRKCGFSRISLGVQDFHDDVQKAINRVQDFNKILHTISFINKYEFESVNIDLVYGLPLQTIESFRENVKVASDLDTTRITITKYSHLPSSFPSQRLLEKYPFPKEHERLIMFSDARDFLKTKGFHLVGLDHFVKEKDPLFSAWKEKKILRNFLGYDKAYSPDILGLGTSSISCIGGNYFQNIKNKGKYYESTINGKFPIEKLALKNDEKAYIWFCIHNLMCYKELKFSDFVDKRNIKSELYFEKECAILKDFQEDGLVKIDKDHLKVTDLGELFLRNICSVFDPRIRDTHYKERFSIGI